MRKQAGPDPSGTTDAATKAYVDGRYQAIAAPAAYAYAGSNVFTLPSSASIVLAVSVNGITLQPSEYALTTATTVTVTLGDGVSWVTGDKVVIVYGLTGYVPGTSAADLVDLRAPNGTVYRVTVNNAGSLVTAVRP